MFKKKHKNWEEIKRLRSYSPDKYPRIINLKPTKVTWIIEVIIFCLFIFPAFISLLLLYVSNRDTLLLMPMFILGGIGLLILLHLWKLKYVIWKVPKKISKNH